MSKSQGSSGRPPPTDDRTLLDPLNADELRALREARQRVQQSKSSAVAHQVVVGPDSGEDIGEAPTRATPSLPSFDGRGTSIDSIQTHTMPVDSVSARSADPAMAPSSDGVEGRGPSDRKPAAFGENTLLWMQPPKIVRDNTQSTIGFVTGDLAPKPGEIRSRRIKSLGVAAVGVAMVAALAIVSQKTERGVLELHSNPNKAQVTIDGHLQSEVAPVKLTLPVGPHEIRLELEGYKPAVVNIDVKKSEEGAEGLRQEIDLEPISKPGLMTVSVAVQPVSARITLDGAEYLNRRTLMVANLDPKKAHRIVVEAGGYVKIEQEVLADQLKASYNFVMQPDPDAKAQ